ncbi:MAG TPA: NADH:flavin oxidoreductase [Burkholderiales bacterium]|nr:NADH:flavin oxidoreductase [Burkholderiales bacterium]
MRPLFEPAALGPLRLANRVVLSPMTRMQAHEDGTPTEAMARYYARYARHGVALVTTEAAYIDDAASRAYFNQPGMTGPRHAAGWKRIVEAVHAAGRPIVLQLQHGGRLSEPGLHACALGASGEPPAGSSWQGGKPYAGAPLRAATQPERDSIVRAFAAAARRARECGFDGVEVHGARGYLLDEFLSQPGLALAERLAMPCAVLRAVREAFPAGLLSFNLSLYKMDDVNYQAAGGKAEVAAVARAVAASGVDALHVTTRRVLREEPYGEPLARTVREAVPDAGLIVNGGIRTLEDAEAALAQTGAQCVALARALLANPDWMERARSGAPMEKYAPGMERQPLE